MTFHSFVAGVRSLTILGLSALALATARAAVPAHEAMISPATDGADPRAYTVCVRQRGAGEGQCIWTLRVEEDVAGTLPRRRYAAQASDDGLRVAVVLRKRSGGRVIDELWRFHQQMNPDFAVPETPAERALITRSKLIATGYPLSFSANLALTRFVIGDERRLRAIDDHGNVLANLHEARGDGATLDIAARRGTLAGFAETGANGMIQRLVATDLDALDADTYSIQGLHRGDELAWNLDRAWLATTDFPAVDNSAAIEARARAATPTTLRVLDLAYRRVLFETAQAGIALQPAWIDADTLSWRLDDKRLQTHKFDTRAGIGLLQGTVRVRGERLMFLPCRERNVLVIDEAASARDITELLRQDAGRSAHYFVEAFGSRVAASVSLDALAHAGNDADGCRHDPDRAVAEAAGERAIAWKLVLGARELSLERAGRPPLVLPAGRLRWNEGRRTMAIRSAATSVDLDATPGACRDPVSGHTHSHRFTLRVGAPGQPVQELRGCGHVLRRHPDEIRAAPPS